MYPQVAATVQELLKGIEEIPAERRAQLDELVQYTSQRLEAKKPVCLTFICTHNSRRSHLSQIWAQTAAAHFGLEGVVTYSGGTEATAFNPRAVRALKRAGFRIDQTTSGGNPIYHVRYSDRAFPITCFSKFYSGAPNPKADFAAIMTCTSADASCPIVQGADVRIAIPYEDPKAFDGTPKEEKAYDERCRQIGTELLYVFLRAAEAQETVGG